MITATHDEPHHMVLDIGLPAGTDPSIVSSLRTAVERAVRLVIGSDEQNVIREADQLAKLVTGLIEPNVELIEERLNRMKTIRKVLEQGDWLTAEQLNALQSAPPANRSHPASDWKRRGRIFGVNHGGKEFFARYQFDALYQPLPIIKEILSAFGDVADTWKIAIWFHFPSGWIVKRDGVDNQAVPPKDALDQRDVVVSAARRRRASYVA